MKYFFNEYLEYKKSEVQKLKGDFTLRELQQSISLLGLGEKRGLERALQLAGFGVLGELQKVSPLTGKSRENFQPARIALKYKDAGVCGISISTDAEFFQWDKSYINLVKPLLQLPIVRNELIIDEFQLYESRAIGADAVILVSTCLDPVQLKDYLQLGFELGLECLVEIQNEKELEQALKAEAQILGVNNRVLINFQTELETSYRLIREIPENVYAVSEYGIGTPGEVSRLQKAGFDGILIGDESLPEKNPEKKLKELIEQSFIR